MSALYHDTHVEPVSEDQRELYNISPKTLILDAFKLNREIGSCTVVTITLDKTNPYISTENIGDSGYMIIRPEQAEGGLSGVEGKIIF